MKQGQRIQQGDQNPAQVRGDPVDRAIRSVIALARLSPLYTNRDVALVESVTRSIQDFLVEHSGPGWFKMEWRGRNLFLGEYQVACVEYAPKPFGPPWRGTHAVAGGFARQYKSEGYARVMIERAVRSYLEGAANDRHRTAG